MRTLFLLAALALVAPGSVVAQGKITPATEQRPVLYNLIDGAPTDLDRKAEKAYADGFKVVETSEKEGFKDARIKGYFFSINDPRSTRLWQVPGYVEVVYVVNPEGRVSDVKVTESTDPRFAKPMLDSVRARRFFPARYKGTPVFSLWTDSQRFGGGVRDGNGYPADGLGIMGYRDR